MKIKQQRAVIYGALVEPACGQQRPLFAMTARLWNPPTDIFESEDRAVIRIEASGLVPETIKMRVEGRRLIVCGRRNEPRFDDLVCYHLSEIQYGPFERIFEFPYPPAIENMRMNYENGFLTIEVLKESNRAAATVSISIVQAEKEL